MNWWSTRADSVYVFFGNVIWTLMIMGQAFLKDQIIFESLNANLKIIENFRLDNW